MTIVAPFHHVVLTLVAINNTIIHFTIVFSIVLVMSVIAFIM